MCKRILRAITAGLLVNLLCCAPAAADSKSEAAAAKVKAAVFKIGTGPGAVVKVRLRDKTRLKGYIREADEEGFVVVDWETGTATRVAYSQAKEVRQFKSRDILTAERLGGVVTLAVIIAIGVGYVRK